MRFFFLFLIISLFTNKIHSQENNIFDLRNSKYNINPNKNGEPWIVGGLRELTKKDRIKLLNTPRFSLNQICSDNNTPNRRRGQFKAKKTLPTKINNATHKAFRPIFRQTGNSCAQASGIGYHFTYEMNLLRGTSANIPVNQYPSHYTWAMMNWGGNYGSMCNEGWDLLIENGCPNIPTYGSMDAGGDLSFWMSGYDKYRSAMKNRVANYKTIDVSKSEGITTLKHWIFDHGRGDKVGGLANFGTYSRGASIRRLKTGTEDAGKMVVTAWGTTGKHALTIVGYNDNICFDYNNDGKYTNDIDINQDGKVDLNDWERGAFIIANTWGTSWGNRGFCYMMYKVCAGKEKSGGISDENLVHILNVEDKPSPKLTLKLKLKCTKRENLKISLGYTSKNKGTTPEYKREFKMFNDYTGEHNLRGKNFSFDDALEVELDISDFYDKMVDGKGKFYCDIGTPWGKVEILETTISDLIRKKQYKAAYTDTKKFEHSFAVQVIPLNPEALLLTDHYYKKNNYVTNNWLGITEVELADISNSSERKKYSNFTNLTAFLTKGETYEISVKYGDKSRDYKENFVYAWIDWNQNGVFEHSENAFQWKNYEKKNKAVDKIKVPEDAKSGITMMRVRTSDTEGNTPRGKQYCPGEAEDYTIKIVNKDEPLHVEFSANNRIVTAGNMVSFTNKSVTGAESYKWEFQGGTPETSEAKNPTIVYNNMGKYDVNLTVTKNGKTKSVKLKKYINVLPVNSAPTDIILSNSTIEENSPIGTIVGELSSTDADKDDTHTFEIVDNNEKVFIIDGNKLKLDKAVDFETKNKYNIKIKTVDNHGSEFSKEFTVKITDVDEFVNSVPTNIILSNNTISEDSGIGSVVGALTTVDDDTDDTHKFELTENEGNTFVINGNKLKLNKPVDFETKSEYQVKIKTIDNHGGEFSKIFTININDVDEFVNSVPTDIILSKNTIAENTEIGSVVGELTSIDTDKNDTHIFELTVNEGDVFKIESNKLILNKQVDFEIKKEYQITIKVTDNNDGVFSKEFMIQVEKITSIIETENFKLKLYPNPVNEILYISGISIKNIEVYSLSGKKLLSEMFDSDNIVSKKLIVSNLLKGIYIIKITTNEDKIVKRKFLKK